MRGSGVRDTLKKVTEMLATDAEDMTYYYLGGQVILAVPGSCVRDGEIEPIFGQKPRVKLETGDMSLDVVREGNWVGVSYEDSRKVGLGWLEISDYGMVGFKDVTATKFCLSSGDRLMLVLGVKTDQQKSVVPKAVVVRDVWTERSFD